MQPGFTMKCIHLLLALLLPASGAFAQLGFGVEGGVGIATMKFAPVSGPYIPYTASKANPVAAFKIGAFIDNPLTNHLTFQGGVYLSRKGAVRTFGYHLSDSFNQSYHEKLLINYLEIPVGLCWKSGAQGKGRVIAAIGAAPAYILGGSSEVNDELVYNGVRSVTNKTTVINAANRNPAFDIALNLSAGYELPVGLFFRTWFTTGTRNMGMGTSTEKNRTVGVTAGYIFGKGRNINRDADDLIDHSTDTRKKLLLV